jgi:hypothetical protein
MIIGTAGLGLAPLGYGGLMERISIFPGTGFSFVLGIYMFIVFDLMERKHQVVCTNDAIAGQS